MRWTLLSLVGVAWIYSSVWPSIAISRLLQHAYAASNDAAANDAAVAIVVLAGDGVTPNAYQRRTLLGEHTLVRLEKAYDLAIQRPELRVITTGGMLYGADPSITLGRMMSAWLIEKGLPVSRIVVDETSANTYESARNAARLVCSGGRAVFVVTEAIHMPRSTAAFSAQGCDPIPAPCSLIRAEGLNAYQFFPSGAGLAQTQAAAHEVGGFLWYWLSGKLARTAATP